MSEVQIECAGMLFDNDGVLISSIASAERCWKRWAKHYGVPDAENFQIPHGVRAIDIVRMTKPDIDADAGLKLIEDWEIEDVGDVEVLRGVRALVTSLPKARWTIVTSAGRRLIEARVQAAGLPLPEKIVTANDVTLGKPDPEPYRRGAEILGFAPAECVVVEDAPSGVKAGLAAGARVLGVLGTHDAAALREAGANWVVDSLEDVRASVAEGGLRLSLKVLVA